MAFKLFKVRTRIQKTNNHFDMQLSSIIKLYTLLGITLFISLGHSPLLAQSIIEEPVVTELMDSYVTKNKKKNYIKGWRVQLLATTNRRTMESTKGKFARTFPHLRSFWTHKDPYYYLRAGAFANKLEALYELERIKKRFPNAYIVMDKIKYSELIPR